MMVSGFTLVRKGTHFDYPFLESLRSLLPLVHELVVNVGVSDDDTLERLHQFARDEGQGKVVLFESHWPLDDPAAKKGGLILSQQTNLALERCTGDWCIYLQADEVLHEEDYPALREALLKAEREPQIDALVFDYLHFYGSFDVIQVSRSTYRREVRAFKRTSGARSIGDAQSFRKSNGAKLSAALAHTRVFHYGWVRPPEQMREKTFFMDQLYHGEPTAEEIRTGTPRTGDNFRYKRIWGLFAFKKTHPAVMHHRIQNKNWHWDLTQSPSVISLRDLKKIGLDLFERATGIRLFEYRSYRLFRP